MPPTGFPAEAALHRIVEEAPNLLPLSGAPQLTVVGREVALGNGYADLVALEKTGRVVVIEVKLARNAEARRAVVAQVLAYAAYLHGLSPLALEGEILGSKLRQRGYNTLADAVRAMDQEGSFDDSAFAEGLKESLAEGRFRLVLVLDDAPDELVRLVGYLEGVAEKLVIDLITVALYDANGTQVLVPQRVDPEPVVVEPTGRRAVPRTGHLVEGPSDFEKSIEASPVELRAELKRLYDWARSLEREGLVALYTYHGIAERTTLLPRLRDERVGLATVWNDRGAKLQVFRSVFERRAPEGLRLIEKLLAEGDRIGQGNYVKVVSDELLAALTQAYREAIARGVVA
jgi:hypothetical protein